MSQDKKPDESSPIQAKGLIKRFGDYTAVDKVSFSVRSGEITGFLGRNGAGKTTTLRMILGLERPTSGTVTVNGLPYGDLIAPLRHVGSLLDARAVQPGSTATEHLLALGRSNGIPNGRVTEVLDTVGLSGAARKRTGTFSLGMLQRLGLAAALLGDPPILVLDEPLNGLDPEGIIWFRTLMRQMASEGRTVLVSSHLMTEMSATADRLLIIGDGQLLVDSDMETFQLDHEHEEIHVRTSDPQKLRARIIDAGGRIRDLDDGSRFAVSGLDSTSIGALAHQEGVELHELAPMRRSLEDAFMEITDLTPTSSVSSSTAATISTTPSGPTSVQPGSSATSMVAKAPAGHRFADAVWSELTKVGSTLPGPLIVAGTLLAGVGSGALFGNSVGQRFADLSADDRRSFDPTYTSLRGRSLTQVSLSILGALAMTAEYGVDTIVPSLTAVPSRGRLLAAKALTTGSIGLVTALATNSGAFLLGQAMLKRHGAPHNTFRSPGSARAIFGGTLHLTASTLIGLGIGTLTRSTAGAIATTVGAELLVPGLAPAFPKPVPALLAKYWLTEAGASIFMTRHDPKTLTPWGGLAVTTISSAAILAAAAAVFTRRDV